MKKMMLAIAATAAMALTSGCAVYQVEQKAVLVEKNFIPAHYEAGQVHANAAGKYVSSGPRQYVPDQYEFVMVSGDGEKWRGYVSKEQWMATPIGYPVNSRVTKFGWTKDSRYKEEQKMKFN